MDHDGLQRQFQDLNGRLDELDKKVSSLDTKIASLKSTEEASQVHTPPISKPAQVPTKPINPQGQYSMDFKKSYDSESLEKNLGIKWMVVVGVVAILLALVYEVRIAIQKGWITEEVRCASAAVLGTLLLAIGYATREKYRRYGEVLMSGGIVSMLVGIYSAHYMYSLIGSRESLAMIAIVAIASAVTGWKTYSKAPLYIGALGCYIAPFLLKAFGASVFNLFAFLTILNSAYLVLAIGMRSLPLNLLCLYAANGVYAFTWWHVFKQDSLNWKVAFVYQVVQTLCFGFATLLPSLFRKERLSELASWTIFPAIMLFYFFAGQILLKNAESYHLLFAISVMLFVGILSQIGRISLKLKTKDHVPSIMVTTALILISTHLIYHNCENISLSWGIFILFYFCIFAWKDFGKPKVLAVVGIFLGYLVLNRLNIDFGYETSKDAIPFINAQFPMFLILCFSLLVWPSRKEAIESHEIRKICMIAGQILALRALQIEASRMAFAGSYYTFVVTALWVAYASALLVTGMIRNSQNIRTQALAIFGLCTLKVFIYDTAASSLSVKAASYFVLGAVLTIAGFFYQKYRRKK